MNISFLSVAETELDDAFDYYEAQQDGLGYRFIDEVWNALSRIAEFPDSYQIVGQSSRRCLVHKFPYGVIYQHRAVDEDVLVVAIAHLHRKPDYWVSREL